MRDRAILLVGFAGALRRSQLAAIRVEHLEKTDRGIRLTLPHSNGAQDSAVHRMGRRGGAGVISRGRNPLRPPTGAL